MQNIVFQHIK